MAVTYTVRSGDTLGAIAQRYNTTVERLVELNNLSNPNMIQVGQVLVIDDQTDSGVSDVGEGADPSVSRRIGGLQYVFGTPRDVYRQGETIPITLRKTNVSGRTLQLFYPTSQRFEFEAVNQSGRVIWNYSSGRIFSQVAQTVTLRPGQSQDFSFNWNQRNNQGSQVVPQVLTLRGYNVASGLRNQFVSVSIRIAGGATTRPPITTRPPFTTRPPITTTPSPGGCQAGVNLLSNPGFEFWSSATSPRSWVGSNVAQSTVRHSGQYAALMGNNPSRNAELYQDVSVLPQRTYRLTFWGREVGSREGGDFNLRTSILYFDNSGNVIGQSDPDYDENYIPNDRFSQFSFTTGRIPSGVRRARVRFTFTPRTNNRNGVAVDDVFLECIL